MASLLEVSAQVVSQHGNAILATAITTVAVLSAARWTLRRVPAKTLTSMRDTLAYLPDDKQQWFIYPSTVMPGRREVKTPYGTFRVYEYGPEDGTKVLFVHGIAIPSPVLQRVADGLVAKGCRVMLFDLWGRGYSDAVGDLPYDERLFTSQIFFALGSSPISWLGGPNGGFKLIGYSFGGAIAANFASYFPELVHSLTLFAPAGIVRRERTPTASPLFNSGLIPDKVLTNAAFKKLAGPTPAGNAEVVAPIACRPNVSATELVAWQREMHKGYDFAFLATLRSGLLGGQEPRWKLLGKRDDKVIIFGGSKDTTIITSELKTDAEKAIGKDNIEWRTFEGTHDFPATHSDEVIAELVSLWGL